MATTKALDSAETVYCTTYYGGLERGICFDLTVVLDGVRATATFTKEELFRTIANQLESRVQVNEGLPRPEFDR